MKMIIFLSKFLLFVVLTIAVVRCGSSDSNNNNTAAQQYRLSNGVCYSNTGQQVASNYCAAGNGYNNGYPSGYNNGYNNGYTMSNGVCYSTQTNQQVPANYCTNTGGYNTGTINGGYTVVNGACYSTATNQPVASTYCTATTGGYPTGGYPTGSYPTGTMPQGASQCMGYYYYTGSGYPQQVTCNGYNCSGYTLYDQYGRQVYCM